MNIHAATRSRLLPRSRGLHMSGIDRFWIRAITSERVARLAIVAVAIATWLPRSWGPIDLRWDGSVHYVLGTSLAQGHGYRLLNEPGDIAAVQYPPLLPAIVALHQLALGTSDPAIVGPWLRATAFLLFVTFGLVTLRFLRMHLRVWHALLGSAAVLLCVNSWFMSDALYPEIGFATATVLFLMCAGRNRSRGDRIGAYVWALVSYALRTVGIVALAVWVLDSALRLQWRDAAVRLVLAALPVLAWQGYVASVERSDAYQHPAYDYQRAPYLFYNVSYARNIALRDPFTPEKGDVQIVRRVARSLLDLPASIGGTLVAPRGYFAMALHRVLGVGPIVDPAITWGLYLLLSAIGLVLTAGGLLGLGLRGELVAPLYLIGYLAALLLTPFPDQYLRYLMPVAPLLVLTAVVFLNAAFGPRRTILAWLLPVLAIQTAVLVSVFLREYQPVSYVDAHGRRMSYRLFYYDAAAREFDEAVNYLQAKAGAQPTIAAGTPHWIYLRTGLKAVMPPFEADPAREQALLDSVPVDYLVVGTDVIHSERYLQPMLAEFPGRWSDVHATSGGRWHIYQREPIDPATRRPLP
jgi:hypothetical protein